MTRATAAGGALVAVSADGAIVQITQANNVATSTGTFTMNNTTTGDFTGDGAQDVPGFFASVTGTAGPVVFSNRVRVGWAGTYYGSAASYYRTSYGPGGTNWRIYASGPIGFSPGLKNGVGLQTITFSDARINGGVTTNARIEVRATNLGANSHTVRLVRLVFDDAVPLSGLPGVIPGGTNPEWVDPVAAAAKAALQSKLSRKIKKLKLKAKNAKRAGNFLKAVKLKGKIRKLKKKLKSL